MKNKQTSEREESKKRRENGGKVKYIVDHQEKEEGYLMDGKPRYQTSKRVREYRGDDSTKEEEKKQLETQQSRKKKEGKKVQ